VDERELLDNVATWYQQEGFEGRMNSASGERLIEHVEGRSCLEIGCAMGKVTSRLSRRCARVVVVEATSVYAKVVSEMGLPNVTVVQQLAEEFHTDERFDTIVISHVLEHVQSPDSLLRRCVKWLQPGGVILVVVPNAGSLHRRIGVLMNVLAHETELAEADIAIGHRRVYNPTTLRADISAAGLRVERLSGHFTKPLSNAQMDALPAATQEAFLDLGDQLAPELASELLAVCRVREV
jgi:2-polyprenyl-3-methyl-5-hydroxy-6-metoxy-1,4-benzoquinol methylase